MPHQQAGAAPYPAINVLRAASYTPAPFAASHTRTFVC